jgi:hypothetical protein
MPYTLRPISSDLYSDSRCTLLTIASKSIEIANSIEMGFKNRNEQITQYGYNVTWKAFEYDFIPNDNRIDDCSGNIMIRSIFYDFPRVLCLDSVFRFNSLEIQSLLFKANRKDGYVFAGHYESYSQEKGPQSFFFGNEEKNFEILNQNGYNKALLNVLGLS